MDGIPTAVGIAYAALFPILNPIGHAPMFYFMTPSATPADRKRIALRTSIYSTLILLVALIAGKPLMEFFGITVDTLRISGGLLVALAGFGMLNNHARITSREQEAATEAEDIAFVPFAMPILSGPGAIALAIGLTSYGSSTPAMIGYALGILLLGLTTLISLNCAERLVRVLGEHGAGALNRILGLVIMTIGVDLIATGILHIARSGKA